MIGVIVCIWLCVFNSGGADDFVLCNCVVDAMKIDRGLSCAAPRVLLW